MTSKAKAQINNIPRLTNITWDGHIPIASDFDDFYYQCDGLAESQFVFLGGIGAPNIWQDDGDYTIVETGFGTGLNFLTTAQKWLACKQSGTLTFISIEAFPMDTAVLEKAHAAFPEVAELSSQLRRIWPMPEKGYHVRSLQNGRIKLILIFNDVAEALAELSARVDAWYLDGFSPAKNPAMWSNDVLDHVARLSSTGTRLATFTAAGFIRRGLIDRNFEVFKAPGFGKKRERMTARYKGDQNDNAVNPYSKNHIPDWAHVSHISAHKVATAKTIIIGAGIAGASIAYELKKNGHSIKIIADQNTPVASTVSAAILMPLFQINNPIERQFYISSFSYALQHPAYQDAFISDRGITVKPSENLNAERLQKIAQHFNWGNEWLKLLENKGQPELFLQKTGTVCTKTVLKNLLQDIDILDEKVTSIRYNHGQWFCLDAKNTILAKADNIVIAAGPYSTNLSQKTGIKMYANIGQADTYPAHNFKTIPAHSFSFGGYLTPAYKDQNKQVRMLGSTFESIGEIDDQNPIFTNLNSLTEITDNMPRKTTEILHKFKSAFSTSFEQDKVQPTDSFCGMRALSLDHLPYVGPVANSDALQQQYALLAKDKNKRWLGYPPYEKGLYMLTGMGAKGYQYAPYAASYLAALICGKPLTIPSALIPKLHPSRLVIKRIIKNLG